MNLATSLGYTGREKMLSRSINLVFCMIMLYASVFNSALFAQASSETTVILVHGAMADSSTWNGVIPKLQAHGYKVIAVANPLRGVKADSEYLSSMIGNIKGPVVLAGHSYGGLTITNAALGHSNVKALVYVAAFAPDKGENAGGLIGKFPGSLLGAALAPPVPLANGDKDIYVDPTKFGPAFAGDLSAKEVQLLATDQRPVAASALSEASGDPAWQTIPSFFIYGSADKSIPPAALEFMAKRARARKVVVVPDASHVVMISHPDAVAQLIEVAAKTAEN